MNPSLSSTRIAVVVLVASLGYAVDVFDIVLFSIFRIQSLSSMGLDSEQALSWGVYILNMQLFGMVLGGIAWGVLGDKIGRMQVLFASILMYSAANIINAYIQDPNSYAWCRFFAGIGLAGEAGAAVTLVSELMSRTKRGIGTVIVASAGTVGAVLGCVAGEYLEWRTAFLLGGIMGLALLVLRVSVVESAMFNALKSSHDVSRGSLLLLVNSRQRFTRYLACILAGLPLFFCFYTAIAYSPEIARALGIQGSVAINRASLVCFIAMTIGDLCSGVISQKLHSRRTTLFFFTGIAAVGTALLLTLSGASPSLYYTVCGFIGFGLGYWSVFLTTAAEQFGTNIRSTVTSTVPNFLRAAPILMTTATLAMKPHIGYIEALWCVGALSFALSFYGIIRMTETFGVDLNYVELKKGTRNLDIAESDIQLAA